MTNSDLGCWFFGWGTGGEGILKDVDSRSGDQSNPCNEQRTFSSYTVFPVAWRASPVPGRENLGSTPEHPLQIILAGESVSIFPP